MSKQPEKRFLDRAYQLRGDEETRVFYEQWAEVYDEELTEQGYQQPIRCADMLRRFVDPGPEIAILDVGCGSGLSGLALREAGYVAIDGCDYSEAMLERAEACGAYRRLFATNLNEPPLDAGDGQYDAVTCVGVFSFGHVMADALDDILRVIKPGGVLVIGLNDHFYQEGSLTAKLSELESAGSIDGVIEEHGDHIAGAGLTGWVIKAHKS